MDNSKTLSEMAAQLGINYRRIERACRVGRLGVSGAMVKLERYKTERGWVTTDEAVELFRQRLNDPQFGIQDHAEES